MDSKLATDRELAKFVKDTPRGERGTTAVTGPPGLTVRVSAAGKVTFLLRYRDPGGKQRGLTIKTKSLAEARSLAETQLAQARLAKAQAGVDPWEANRAEKMAAEEAKKAKDRTVTQMVLAWVGEDHDDNPKAPSREAAAWRPRTLRETRRLLNKHIVPVFGDRDPKTLTRREVRHALDKIAQTAPSEANHAHAALRGLYGWLRKERQEDQYGIMADPTQGLEKPGGRPKTRDDIYTPQQIPRIVAAVDGTAIRDLVLILFYTGTRDRETRSMRWADVDLGRGVWVIPPEQSKNGRRHDVALSTVAVEILKKRSRLGGFVFPNPETATGFVDRPNHKVLRAVAIKAGLLRNVGKEDKPKWEGEALRLHDIRRTVGQWLRNNHGEATMHSALGHADLVLTKTYGPTPPFKKIAEAMEEWATGENGLKTILGQQKHTA